MFDFVTSDVERNYGVVVGIQSGISKTGKPYKMYSIVNNNMSVSEGNYGFTVETVFDNCEKEHGIKLGDVVSILYRMNGNFKQGIGYVDIKGNVVKTKK